MLPRSSAVRSKAGAITDVSFISWSLPADGVWDMIPARGRVHGAAAWPETDANCGAVRYTRLS